MGLMLIFPLQSRGPVGPGEMLLTFHYSLNYQFICITHIYHPIKIMGWKSQFSVISQLFPILTGLESPKSSKHLHRISSFPTCWGSWLHPHSPMFHTWIHLGHIPSWTRNSAWIFGQDSILPKISSPQGRNPHFLPHFHPRWSCPWVCSSFPDTSCDVLMEFLGNLGQWISLEGACSDSLEAFEGEETGLGSPTDPVEAEGFSSPLQRQDRAVLPPCCLSFPRVSWLCSAPGMVFPSWEGWNQKFGNPESLRLPWITQETLP